MKRPLVPHRTKSREDSLQSRPRHGLLYALTALALILAAQQPVSAKDSGVGDLFGLGTNPNTPAAKESARPASDTGALFGLEPSAPKTTTGNQGSGNSGDVIGDALAEHDRRLQDQATKELDRANTRMSKHCDCVLTHTSCTTPWDSGSWQESSSFLQQEKDYQQTRGRLCTEWQQITDSRPNDTIDGIKTTTAKVQTIAQRLDHELERISSAASSDRRRYEREEEERRIQEENERIEEERRIARRQDSDQSSPLVDWAKGLEEQNKRNYEQSIRQNEEFARNAQREIDRRQRERAEAQRRQQEERARQLQQQRQQQQANAAAAQAREKERLERERQKRLEEEKQKRMEQERREAERERQRQQEAERQAKLERQRQLEAERQAKKAAEEQARQDYLRAVARGSKAKGLQCPGAIHVIVKPATIKPELVSCIDVYWTAYCPGNSRGIDGISTNAIDYLQGCLGDSHPVSPQPQCAAEQIRVEIREVRACGK